MKLFKTISLLSLCLLISTESLIAEKHKKKNRTYKQVETCKECRKGTKCKSLVCNADELAKQLLQPVCSKTTVTRDSLNRPTISGGSFKDIYYTAGYEAMRDRLWQTYLFTRTFNGQLASLLGPGFEDENIDSDKAIRKTTYSDEEILAQFKNLSKVTRTAFKQWLKGANQRIKEVLDPAKPDAPLPAEFEALGCLPEKICLAELVRYQFNLFASFSSQYYPFLLTNEAFTQIENLVTEAGYSVDEATAIMSDLYNMRLKRASGIIAESADTREILCKLPCKKKADAKSLRKNVVKKSLNNLTVAMHLKKTEALESHKQKMGIPVITRRSRSSFATTISGKYTASGQPIALSGPQANLTQIPGLLSNGILQSDELNFQLHNFYSAGSPVSSGSHGGRNGYIFACAGQVGSLPGIASLLEDPSDDIFLRTDTIEVKGGEPVEVDVFASRYGGFVVEQGLTSPLFEGEKSLVQRNLDFGTDISTIDPLFLQYFASSIEELEATNHGPSWSTGFGLSLNGCDNQGNIFGAERAGWYDWKTSDVIPQGVLGNPIPEGKDLPKKQTGPFIANPCTGYVVDWNSPVVQDLPDVYGDGETGRVMWLEEKITEVINHRKFTSTDAIDQYAQIANSVQGAIYPFDDAFPNYDTDYFHSVFKKRFFKAVKAYPTPEREAAVVLLRDFDGGFIEGDNLAIATSRNISDKWLLAQQWVWEVQAAIIENTFGPAWFDYFYSSDKFGSFYFEYNNGILGLISRLLNTSSVTNPINYPNWLTGLDVDLVISEALDRALATLGGFDAQPWGENMRQTTFYTDAVFGGIPFACSDEAVAANRATMYLTSETTQNYGMDITSINQIGQSGLISFEGQEGEQVPVVQDDAQMCSYLRFATTPLVTFSGKKIPQKAHKPKRSKQN